MTTPEELPERPSTSRDRKLAVVCVLGIIGCIVMTFYQLSRAMEGNERSWAYTFEWPLFAVFIIWMWRRLEGRFQAGHEDEDVPGEGQSPER